MAQQGGRADVGSALMVFNSQVAMNPRGLCRLERYNTMMLRSLRSTTSLQIQHSIFMS